MEVIIFIACKGTGILLPAVCLALLFQAAMQKSLIMNVKWQTQPPFVGTAGKEKAFWENSPKRLFLFLLMFLFILQKNT